MAASPSSALSVTSVEQGDGLEDISTVPGGPRVDRKVNTRMALNIPVFIVKLDTLMNASSPWGFKMVTAVV